MTIQSGDFWVAEIPFTNGLNSKRRPVLILWLDGNDVVVAAVTSAAPRTQTDVLLQDWNESGLRVLSTVRLSRLDFLEKSLLSVKIGHVSPNDAQNLQKVWNSYMKLQF
ncbi:PemK-like protein [Xenococcus sp. PCC 7305]|nr:PemK-like protein [Xenococcus sp. PCC 7305]